MTRSKAPDRLRKAWAVEGLGAEILDSEGNRYLDMVCGLGAISLGYNYHTPKVRGVYSLPHVVEVEAAEAVLQYVAPWASSVRTLKTGSEATHAAYRVAKRVTGRRYVGVAEGMYHGWHEWCASGEAWDVVTYQPDLIHCYKNLAAVFYEPPRFKPVDVELVRSLREYCTSTGTLLVFDSMIYGGRWALGGLGEYSGVVPDLECFGKAVANGEAAAFVVGRDVLAEHAEIVSGTFSGDATGLNAVLDTLAVYTREPVIQTLWSRARLLFDEWQKAVPQDFCTLSQAAPLMRLQFANEAHRQPFKDAMHERGILTYSDWVMTMFAHTEEHMIRVVEAAGEIARGMAWHG